MNDIVTTSAYAVEESKNVFKIVINFPGQTIVEVKL